MSVDFAKMQGIFLAAVEGHRPEEWDAYLDQNCGDDEMRRQVKLLLKAHLEAGSVPGAAADERGQTAASPTAAEAPGHVIGPYKLIEQIGEGGMGTVWMAQQTEPVKRLVAVKLIKAGMDSRQVIARFEAERQALALMDHPNIAKVLDAGATGTGRPYFIMDLVKGVPITHYCDDHHLTPRQRLELFMPVCQAVQHAHQKGIIHRDLKPSNVLVALYDGKPVPKVIDFGVAKAAGQSLTDKTLVTGFGGIVGTLEYMSPEQAEVNQLDIDTRSDIYSLGVLLYELLTGSPPFSRQELEKAGMLEMLRVIREQEPSRPSTKLSTAEALPTLAANRGTEPARLAKLMRGELDWIVMKALEKDRSRRYETTNGLASDLQRYLHNEPVLAGAPSALYRFRKLAQRHKGGLTLVGLVLLFLVLLAGSIGWAVRDRAARQAAIEGEVNVALKEADGWQAQGKWAEAMAAAKRAQALLAGGAGSEAVRQRARDRLADLELVVRLDEIPQLMIQTLAVGEQGYDWSAGDAAYRAAFRRCGLDVEALGVQEAGDWLRARSVASRLAPALEEWAQVRRHAPPPQDTGWKHLLDVAQAVDPQPWRKQLWDMLEQRGTPQERARLEALAASDQTAALPPVALHRLATAVKDAGALDAALALLRKAQHWHPDNFRINQMLADYLVLERPLALDEALRYSTAAVALHPERPGARHVLGTIFQRKGMQDEAITEYREALRLKKDFASSHTGLGNALAEKGRLDEAIAEYREALRLEPNYAVAHTCLGNALRHKGRPDEAIAEYREAIRLKKNFPEAHNGLGGVLAEKGRLDEAIAEFREAIRIQKDFAVAHVNLGHALRLKGQFRQALEETRLGHELGSRYPGWHLPSAQWVKQCERLVELDAQLPGFLEGKTKPASPAERIELAGLCSAKRLRLAAARFYEEAFTAEPRLADDLDAAHRYNAACQAALAGCGHGEDATQLEGKDYARLRHQALDWLRADLEAWSRLLDEEPDKAGAPARVVKTLRHWLADPDFAGVRGPEALTKLPEPERHAWQQLWCDSAGLQVRAQRQMTPEKK